MDKDNKLEALIGDPGVIPASDTWGYNVKARHIYEGTDSEEEEEPEIPLNKSIVAESSRAYDNSGTVYGKSLNDSKAYHLQKGEVAPEPEIFVSWQAVKKYPYYYIGNANRQLVSRHFFDQGKVYNNTWDFFYLNRLSQDINQSPLILVPTNQFESLLKTVNRELGVQLRIPSSATNNDGFRATFPNEGTPRPRYLGRATNRDTADKLHANIPPSTFKPERESSVMKMPSQKSIAAFKAKVDAIMKTQKVKKTAKQEKKKVERAAQEESSRQSIKRVQTYLGIRPPSLAQHAEEIRARLQKKNLQWEEYDEAFRDAMTNLPPPKAFDTEKPVPHHQEESVVFVCVDVEAYERNTRQITEIGIATLDTKDLESLNSGDGGVNWWQMIRARHFRINEYKHLNNTEFVYGCADRFEFGESEFINLKDAPHVVSTCFKPPFSKPGLDACFNEGKKRNIVLVGHDVQSDIRFLKTVGYDVRTLSTLIDMADTSLMWRSFKKESNPRNLATILSELGIIAWNLHNGGNDAVYTLQAMIGIAIRSLTDPNQTDNREEGKYNYAPE